MPATERAEWTGRNFRLRPIYPEDHHYLFDLVVSQDSGYRWRYGGGVPSFETFSHTLDREQCQFLVTRRTRDEPVGLVNAYAIDYIDGHAHVGVLMEPAYVGSGMGLEPVGLFINYLFTTYAFRKVYFEAYDFTMASHSGRGRLFTEEGTLTEHHYHAGRYWDLHILALHRAQWARLSPHFIRFFCEVPDADGQDRPLQSTDLGK